MKYVYSVRTEFEECFCSSSNLCRKYQIKLIRKKKLVQNAILKLILTIPHRTVNALHKVTSTSIVFPIFISAVTS